ncbi:MAG: formylglycine-generating enzyme family protein [Gammaproteobacteria bacterium]|nr:formylglycine-generating enzyme family protein [Gammaproteobacteria bacterium]
METGTGQTQRKVWVDGFAMGAYEVTFAEYDRFAEATHREKTDDSGYGRGNRPVINITWEDAVAYTEWLSEQTERRYRLPAEAEWEYAARAGTQTKYWWGNDIGVNRAACSSCGSQWDDKQTAPAGSFAANSFGLYDTAGNVWEWTCSEYEEKASGENCSAKAGDEGLRAVRGGAWDSLPQWACASCRYGLNPTYRYLILGFRVAAVR